MTNITEQRILIEATIAEMEKKITELQQQLSEKKALLPGIIFIESTQNKAGQEPQAESQPNEPRLRLGAHAVVVFKILELTSFMHNPLSIPELLLKTKLSPKEFNATIRNLKDRKFLSSENGQVALTNDGEIFWEKYKAKNKKTLASDPGQRQGEENPGRPHPLYDKLA
jgi:predicted transcriptional regulator